MHTRPVRLLPAAGVPVETTEAARAAADGTAGWTVVHDVAANVALASSEPSVAGLTLAQDLCSFCSWCTVPWGQATHVRRGRRE